MGASGRRHRRRSSARNDDGTFTLRNLRFDRYLHEDATGNVDTIGLDILDDSVRWHISPVN